MLPKPEKQPKKSKNSEQLNLVDSLDSGKAVESRRRLVIVLLIFTVGLSIVFSIYRYVNYIIASKQYPKISVPDIKIDKPVIPVGDNSIETQVQSLLSSDSWSIKIHIIEGKTAQQIWAYGEEFEYDPAKIAADLSKSSLTPDSVITPVLPQGLVFKEKVVTSDLFSEHQLLITLPKKQLLIISRLNSNDLSVFKQKLPVLIDTLYWYAIKQ